MPVRGIFLLLVEYTFCNSTRHIPDAFYMKNWSMEKFNIQWWHVMISLSLRYLMFSGVAYIVFYIWRRPALCRFKIQPAFPKSTTVRTELLFSMITILIFALAFYGIVFSPLRAYTLIYTDFHEYSVIYFVLSFVLVILIHDTYFYWIHRLMHWRTIFKYVHHIHHRSHNPTPLAAFSFHPIEAVLEIGFLPIIVFILPIHNLVLLLFGIYMILHNVVGHLGFELFPERFGNSRLFRWINTSTHHNMHHHYGVGNYGLYFNLWDRLAGTNHGHYEEEFKQVTRRSRVQKSSASERVSFSHSNG